MPTKEPSSWPSPSEELSVLLAEHVARYPVERRMMFASPCYFVRGNMFTGVVGEQLFLRLSPPDREKMLREMVGRPFVPKQGRVMREYCVLSDTLVHDEKEMVHWLDLGYAYVSQLPPKSKKQRPAKRPTLT